MKIKEEQEQGECWGYCILKRCGFHSSKFWASRNRGPRPGGRQGFWAVICDCAFSPHNCLLSGALLDPE